MSEKTGNQKSEKESKPDLSKIWKCGFCHRGSEVETVCGKLHIQFLEDENQTLAAHQRCMEYSADLTRYKFDNFGGFIVEEVLREIKRGKLLKCSICKVKGKKKNKDGLSVNGATAGCAIKRCDKTFHYYCANKSETAITKNFPMVVKSKSSTGDKGAKGVMYRVFCCEDHEHKFTSNKSEIHEPFGASQEVILYPSSSEESDSDDSAHDVADNSPESSDLEEPFSGQDDANSDETNHMFTDNSNTLHQNEGKFEITLPIDTNPAPKQTSSSCTTEQHEVNNSNDSPMKKQQDLRLQCNPSPTAKTCNLNKKRKSSENSVSDNSSSPSPKKSKLLCSLNSPRGTSNAQRNTDKNVDGNHGNDFATASSSTAGTELKTECYRDTESTEPKDQCGVSSTTQNNQVPKREGIDLNNSCSSGSAKDNSYGLVLWQELECGDEFKKEIRQRASQVLGIEPRRILFWRDVFPFEDIKREIMPYLMHDIGQMLSNGGRKIFTKILSNRDQLSAQTHQYSYLLNLHKSLDKDLVERIENSVLQQTRQSLNEASANYEVRSGVVFALQDKSAMVLIINEKMDPERLVYDMLKKETNKFFICSRTTQFHVLDTVPSEEQLMEEKEKIDNFISDNFARNFTLHVHPIDDVIQEDSPSIVRELAENLPFGSDEDKNSPNQIHCVLPLLSSVSSSYCKRLFNKYAWQNHIAGRKNIIAVVHLDKSALKYPDDVISSEDLAKQGLQIILANDPKEIPVTCAVITNIQNS